jgi:hypothetical protein
MPMIDGSNARNIRCEPLMSGRHDLRGKVCNVWGRINGDAGRAVSFSVLSLEGRN